MWIIRSFDSLFSDFVSLRFIIVSVGLAALLITAVTVNMWTKTKGKFNHEKFEWFWIFTLILNWLFFLILGKKTQMDENTVSTKLNNPTEQKLLNVCFWCCKQHFTDDFEFVELNVVQQRTESQKFISERLLVWTPHVRVCLGKVDHWCCHLPLNHWNYY